MSLFKNKTFGFIVFFLIVSCAWGQTPPATPTICTTPPAGYLKGGEMSLSPPISCVNLTGSTLTPVQITNKRDPALGFTVDNPMFYIDVNNSFNIATAINGVAGVANSTIQNLTIGYHWILMKGEKNGNKYIGCILQENIRTAEPVVTASACGGNTVTITIPADPENQHNSYSLNWGNGTTDIINTTTTPLPFVKSKTYTGPPNNITIQGKYIRNNSSVCSTNFKQIIPDSERSLLIHTLDGEAEGKEAKIQFVGGKAGDIYKIEGAVDNGTGTYSWKELADGINGNATITGLDANLKYCFRTKSKNSCNLDVYSVNTICTINLKANIKSSTTVDLKWNLPAEPNSIPTRLSMYREQKGAVNASNNNPITNTTTTSWTDPNLDCANTYGYRVSARFGPIAFGGTQWPINIRSAQISVDPKSNLVSIKPNDLVSVGFDPNDDSRIRVSIAIDPNDKTAKNFTFFRAENDSQDFTKLGVRTTNVFDDVAINQDIKSYCYKYQVEDKCGVVSELSNPFCTIRLNSQSAGVLNWTPYLIPPDIFTSASPVEYSLEYFDESINSYIPIKTTDDLEQSVQDLINASEQAEMKFRVMGKQFVTTSLWTNQFINSYSNPYTIKVPPGLFIPNAFTPDNQGPSGSETFKLNSKFVAEASFKIFDRWGGTIFEGLSIADEWNGTEQNGITPAPPGTYVYVIKAVSSTGEAFKMMGSVLLLR